MTQRMPFNLKYFIKRKIGAVFQNNVTCLKMCDHLKSSFFVKEPIL